MGVESQVERKDKEGTGWFMKSRGKNLMEGRERCNAIERASWTEASLQCAITAQNEGWWIGYEVG